MSSISAAAGSAVQWRTLAVLTLAEDLELRREWDVLNARNGHIPILEADVVAIAFDTLDAGVEKLVVGRRGASVVGMTVLTPQFPMRWSTFQPSQLPLGTLVALETEDLAELGASLMRGPSSSALIMSFTQTVPSVIARASDAPDVRANDYIRTAWIDVGEGFDTFWAARRKNLRQNMRKQRNRRAADGATMQTWREPEQPAPALERYGTLGSNGCKAAGGTAIHIDNAQGRFSRTLFEAAARRGKAVVYEYRLGTRPGAMNLCIHAGGTLVVLKTTYDKSVKPMPPAFLLQEDQLRSIFAPGEFRRIEYYGRLMEWHTKWTDSSRTLFHTTVYRWPSVRRLAEWRHRPAGASTPVDLTSTPPTAAP